MWERLVFQAKTLFRIVPNPTAQSIGENPAIHSNDVISNPVKSPVRFHFATAARVIFGLALIVTASLLAACYPRYDWRDYRPECGRGWCGFVASFPGRVTSATRAVPVANLRLPLTLHVVSVGDVTFAIGAFELLPGSDAQIARKTFETKLLDDVGATDGRSGSVTLHAADRTDIEAATFEAEGQRGGKRLKVVARFVQRRDREIEILVIGPAEGLASNSGRQAIETFLTSLRLD